MQKRLVHFANNVISIEYKGDIPSHLVDFLFRHVPKTGLESLHLNYRLTIDAKNDLVLFLGNERENQALSMQISAD